jgi:hypothetical protein
MSRKLFKSIATVDHFVRVGTAENLLSKLNIFFWIQEEVTNELQIPQLCPQEQISLAFQEGRKNHVVRPKCCKYQIPLSAI